MLLLTTVVSSVATTTISTPAISELLLPPWQKEIMFSAALVCLSVCLFADNITRQAMNGFG